MCAMVTSSLSTALCLLFWLLFQCQIVLSYDICHRVTNGEQLDLVAIAVTPRRLYMLSSNFYVYEFQDPDSAFDQENNRVYLDGAPKPLPLQAKWPELFASMLFQNIRDRFYAIYFVWDDHQDYFVMMNATEGLVFGLSNKTIWALNSKGFIEVYMVTSLHNLQFSGPKGDFFGANNNRNWSSTSLLWSKFTSVYLDKIKKPFAFTDCVPQNILCYKTSRREEVYLVSYLKDDSGHCKNGHVVWWLVTTGFSFRNHLYLVGNNRTVYIIPNSNSIRTFGTAVKVERRTYEEFFQCPLNNGPSTRHSPKTNYRLILIIAISVVSVIALLVLIALCVTACEDGQDSNSKKSLSLVSRLDKKKKKTHSQLTKGSFRANLSCSTKISQRTKNKTMQTVLSAVSKRNLTLRKH